jgi:hypothetical protein
MKQRIRLTESDLHRIIKNAVKKALREDWTKSYDEWSAHKNHKNLCTDPEHTERGEELNKKWSQELKDEYPDADARRAAFNKHTKQIDKKMGRKDDVDESVVRRAVTESLNRFMVKDSKKKVNEAFEDDFNSARDQYLSRKSPNGMFGFEMKNSDGDWQYGDITYDPNTNTMSCMGVSIEVDPSLSIDQNLEGLYEELVNNGYTDGDDADDDEWSEERINDYLDREANYDDFPPGIR